MCGIAGLVDLRPCRDEADALKRICARMAHRGPDGDGVHVDGPVALAHRRLSIIDLAGGVQPMSNQDGTIWVTFNGEIYNFEELKRELCSLAIALSTRSIPRCSCTRTSNWVKRLRPAVSGHVRLRHLGLATARRVPGARPCRQEASFLCRAGGQFVFASEIQGSLEHPGIRRELEPSALDDFLTYGYVPSPKTAFRGVYKLPPAHTLTLSSERWGRTAELKVEPYWRLDYSPKLNLNEDEAADALLETLDRGRPAATWSPTFLWEPCSPAGSIRAWSSPS